MQVGKKKHDHREKTDPFYQSAFWRSLVEWVWIRDQGFCQICLRQGRLTPLKKPAKLPHERGYVDHVRARKQGGSDHESNLQLTCKLCHDIKSNEEKKAQRRN